MPDPALPRRAPPCRIGGADPAPGGLGASAGGVSPPGGRDKGIDLSALAPVAAERAIPAVLTGEPGPGLGASFRAAGRARTEMATDLDDAVRRADSIARQALSSAEPVAAGAAPGAAWS